MKNNNQLIEQVNAHPNETVNQIPTEEAFSYEGYQVVRGEFFAHLFEPSVTFKDEKVSVNASCLNKLPDVEYVQFLVNPIEKKLAVKPCAEELKDSFIWAAKTEQGKRKPKQISCKIFFAKVMNLMGWNPEYRYKILGKLIRTKADILFVFDLTSAETYIKKAAGTAEKGRKAYYPDEWKNQFGVPVKDHQDLTLVSIFDDYTVFKIERNEESEVTTKNDSNNIIRHEEASSEDSQANAASDE